MAERMILETLRELGFSHAIGVHFVGTSGKVRNITYADLLGRSRSFAAALLRRGMVQGEPVVLVMTEPENAVTAILGCMILGCPPAPVYPPFQLRGVPNFLKFLKHVVRSSGATFIVADTQPHAFLGDLGQEISTLKGVEKYGNLAHSSVAAPPQHLDGRNEIAFLQFTSGSTSTPKGVMVTHQGLAANLEMIRSSTLMGEASCVVTWLPVYHDMGLIGTVLNALTLPCRLVVLPPQLFLKKPRLWLELISAYRGTHTASPNFGYGLCARRVSNVGNLDLSSMTTFICGAEPVLPRTMEEFVSRYAEARLRPGAMTPAYGLAEATLAVTFTPHLRGVLAHEVDLHKMACGGYAETAMGAQSVRVSSCGLPLRGMQVRIAAESGAILPERHVGEIQIQGLSVTPGYIGNEEASGQARTEDGWLRTGDLGYVKDGELYPCGRAKDLIIIRGRNYQAHDLEVLASEVEGIRTGNVIAFSTMSGEESESLVLIAETRRESGRQELARQVRSHLAASIGISPDEVVIVPPGTLPKTSSGKLKRSDTRHLYQRGELGRTAGGLELWKVAVKAGFGMLRR